MSIDTGVLEFRIIVSNASHATVRSYRKLSEIMSLCMLMTCRGGENTAIWPGSAPCRDGKLLSTPGILWKDRCFIFCQTHLDLGVGCFPLLHVKHLSCSFVAPGPTWSHSYPSTCFKGMYGTRAYGIQCNSIYIY